jgi:hypothetical protein
MLRSSANLLSMKKKLFLLICGIVIALAIFAFYATMQVRATPGECAQSFAGDNLIPHPIGAVNHAITIHRPPRDVWPWLVQMGATRAGWYSYDFIDNAGQHSSDRILPHYQNLHPGMIFPALPGAKDVFVLVQYEAEKNLVLAWQLPDGSYQTTWAFVLEEAQPGHTRLLVRGRVAAGYRPYGMPQWFALRLGRVAHFIMQRKELLGIARRAEANGT